MPPPTQVIRPILNPQVEASSRNQENIPLHRHSQVSHMASSKPQIYLPPTPQCRKDIDTELKPPVGRIEGLALVKNASMEKQAAHSQQAGMAAGPDSTEDDQSHLSNNSSREPPGFDTKSIASVTTFAMDEKESLRPDDSASVQAVDDEDSSSGQSCDPSIRDEAEPITQPQSLPHSNGNVIGIARRYPSITLANPPRFGDLPMSPNTQIEDNRQTRAVPREMIDIETPRMRGGGDLEQQPAQALVVMPDEKLLDALASQKDRLPLLQLEEKMVSFIIQTHKGGAEILDLPPQNSFGRLLAHKLADYYSLQHVISDDNSSVRLYRMRGLPYSLPISLATLASSIPTGPVPAQGSAAFRIMRRNGLGGRVNSAGASTAASSSAPSKATSDDDADVGDEGLMSPPDGTPQRDKSALTREEREANYKAARERIFADFQESLPSEAASTTGDTSASISRSSSSSGKRKTGKQRRPKDDSFEARSQFIKGGYPTMPIVGQQSTYQLPYTDPSFTTQYSGTPASSGAPFGSTSFQAYPGYENSMQYPSMPNYSSPMQPAYPPSDPWSNSYSSQPGNYYGSHPTQSQPAYAQAQVPHSGLSPYSQPMSMPPPPVSQNWASNQYQSNFQQTPTLQNPQPVQWPNYSHSPNTAGANPYPYGQLPPQPYASPAYNAQHPVPGSYNGNQSLFNPNSRSFVPSNATSRSGGRNSNRNKKSSSSGNQSGQSKQKASGNENASTIPPRPAQPTQCNSSSPGAKDLPLQQKYGAPAHLPKKPPPSQVPAHFEMDMQALKLGGNVNGPLVVNGGGGESRT